MAKENSHGHGGHSGYDGHWGNKSVFREKFQVILITDLNGLEILGRCEGSELLM